MTIDEMREIGRQASRIEAAQEELKQARAKLALLESSFKSSEWAVKTSWTPTIILKKASDNDRYYHSAKDVTIQVEIPFGVVQQQLVNAVAAAERKLVQLGVMP